MNSALDPWRVLERVSLQTRRQRLRERGRPRTGRRRAVPGDRHRNHDDGRNHNEDDGGDLGPVSTEHPGTLSRDRYTRTGFELPPPPCDQPRMRPSKSQNRPGFGRGGFVRSEVDTRAT